MESIGELSQVDGTCIVGVIWTRRWSQLDSISIGEESVGLEYLKWNGVPEMEWST